MPPKKKVARKRAPNSVDDDLKIYRCSMCGKEKTTPDKVFYKLTYSNLHKGNDG